MIRQQMVKYFFTKFFFMKILSKNSLLILLAGIVIFSSILLTSFTGTNNQPTPKTDSISVFEDFFPTGWMGDGEDASRRWLNLDESWKTRPHSSPACVKVTYRPGGTKGWAGIYWQNQPNNWCRSPGENFTNRGFTKIIFWARGEIGGELVEFKAGGINNCNNGGTYHDSFETKAKRITLDSAWKEYTIDLKGKDLKSVIGGFCWSTPAPASQMIFYIDDVYYK
jgi:hypothetical protein